MPADLLFAGYPPQSSEADERYTPRWVFDGMALTFDLDPAAPVHGGDCVPARHRYTLVDDGLTQPWHGLVWLNPPFSNATAWGHRMVDHGCGVLLGPIANAEWAHRVMSHADMLWLCRDFAFTHPTHAGKRSSMPLMFAAFGADACAGLTRLPRADVHDGVLFDRAIDAG